MASDAAALAFTLADVLPQIHVFDYVILARSLDALYPQFVREILPALDRVLHFETPSFTQ